MDICSFGNLTSAVAVAVGNPAAAHFFLVKPVLNQTDEVFDKAFKNTGIEDISKTIDSVNPPGPASVSWRSIRVFSADRRHPELTAASSAPTSNVNRIHRVARSNTEFPGALCFRPRARPK